ncbi:MAG: GNAT family N-acetyltransferase [Actinobacteria bacterium]|nr:GNAT family N-acetyltransferase [Actinomycetota bacterium]
MLIRRATAEDTDAMAKVWLASALTAYADIFPADAPKPTMAALVASLGGAGGFVAVVDGEVVGLVQADDGWLSHLYVRPDHWGGGIGGQLHGAALDHLRDVGCDRASLWVLRDNTPARAMYERRGWVLTDRVRPVYAPAGIDDVGYDRDL